MKPLVWALLILAFIGAGVWLDRVLSQPLTREEFATVGMTLEERVIDIYENVLQRQPSATEMIDATRNLSDGTWTESGLKQRLIDSEEYERFIKLQSNNLAPELDKMVANRALIARIVVIYTEERKTPPPNKMLLPLKDMYVILDYNEYSFRAFLRSEKYEYLEKDAMNAAELDKTAMLNLVKKHMGGVEKIHEAGKELAKEEGKAAADAAKAAAEANKNDAPANTSSTSNVVDGAAPDDKVQRTVDDTDSDMSPMVEDIMKKCSKVFNKDELAKMLDTLNKETYEIPVTQHYGNMVLRPEMSWSVPQKHPRVCTTLGQQSPTQPVMTQSKLLLGTPLNESIAQTSVGSIMPAFEFKEYVPVQVKTEGNAP